ncbi:MAG: hypothetical protein ACOH2J_02975 [Allorhizobium sp.]
MRTGPLMCGAQASARPPTCRMTRRAGQFDRSHLMVASLQSNGPVSPQLHLQAANDSTAAAPVSHAPPMSPAMALLRAFGYETEGSTKAADAADISNDITTTSFMAGLKLTLTAAGADGGSAQADAMLKALAEGTLTVMDAASGVKITAWDADSAGDRNTATGRATAIDRSGWSPFLKSHLTRGSDAAYVKTADGSFVDTPTGEHAFFGTVGSEYVYLTWPKVG